MEAVDVIGPDESANAPKVREPPNLAGAWKTNDDAGKEGFAGEMRVQPEGSALNVIGLEKTTVSVKIHSGFGLTHGSELYAIWVENWTLLLLLAAESVDHSAWAAFAQW